MTAEAVLASPELTENAIVVVQKESRLAIERCAFSIFVLVEIVRVFLRAVNAHPRKIHPAHCDIQTRSAS